MIRRMLIGIVTVLFLAGPLWAQEEFDSINPPPWGASLEQVMAQHTGGTLKEQDKHSLHYKFDGAVSDLDEVYYYFTENDELGAISIYYATSGDRDDLLDIFNGLKEQLAQKFGVPKYDFEANEAGEFDPKMAHLTEKHVVWQVPAYHIMLMVKHDKTYGGVFLNYTGTDYFEYF